MNFRLKIVCPLCNMSHYEKTDEGLIPVGSKKIELPKVFVTHITSAGRAGIKHHQHPLSDLKGAQAHEDIERAVLENMKDQAERLSSLIDYRLQEI